MARVKETKVIKEISDILNAGKSAEDTVLLVTHIVEKYYKEEDSRV